MRGVRGLARAPPGPPTNRRPSAIRRGGNPSLDGTRRRAPTPRRSLPWNFCTAALGPVRPGGGRLRGERPAAVREGAGRHLPEQREPPAPLVEDLPRPPAAGRGTMGADQLAQLRDILRVHDRREADERGVVPPFQRALLV